MKSNSGFLIFEIGHTKLQLLVAGTLRKFDLVYLRHFLVHC